MIPAPLAAAFAKPMIKWGAVGIGVAGLLAWSNWFTYDRMRSACEDEKMIAVQAAADATAKEAHKQLLATIELNSRIAQQRDEKGRELEALQESVRKKARKYANVKVVVPTELLRVHDEYARVSEANRASDPPPADPGTGGAEVQSGAIPTQAEQRVQVTLEGESVEMTGEGAALMLSDTYDKFGLCLRDYSFFNAWNEGREKVELQRLQSSD